MADMIRTKFVDINARHAWGLIRVFEITSAVELAAYATLVQDCVDTHVASLNREIVLVSSEGIPGEAGAYPSHVDMVTLEMETAGYEKSLVAFSGPKSGIFMGDGVTVNAGNASVEAVVEWLKEHGATKGNQPLTNFVKGWRWRMPIP